MWRALLPLAAVLAFAAIAGPAQAGATTFTVNVGGDAHDTNPGDGNCQTGAPGCSIRAALEENDALGGGNTIDFAPAVPSPITLTNGELDAFDNVTIVGPGANQMTIDGAGASRVFQSQFPSTVTISGLTFRNGRVNVGTTVAAGGVYANGDVTLDHVVVTQNTADGGNTAYGGGIAVGIGTLTLRRSTVSDNTATTSGTSATTVNTYGGGIAVFQGSPGFETGLVVDHSTISGNTSQGVIVTPASGTNASGSGGGIYTGGPATIDQSTISGNTASGTGAVSSNIGSGGGYYEDNNGTLTMTGSTVSDNTVVGTGPFTDGANLYLIPTPGATVRSSVVANPTGGNDCFSNGTPLGSNGFNLDEDDTCQFNQTTDLTGDPKLGPLANNGGPTETQALAGDSPVIDKGKSFGATTDQRGTGFPRVSDSPVIANAAGGDGADIGAYELDLTPPNKPLFTGSTPRSPANSNHPKLRGLAEAGSTVRVYKGPCTGTPVAQGPAATFRSPGLAVSVPNNSKTTFRATATDASSNKSACSNAFTYVEDSKPPNTTISSATISSSQHRAVLSFASSEAGSKFQCRLDAQAFAPCNSPKTYTGLSNGPHTFRVRAIDKAGNMDPTPASRAFSI